MMFLFMIYKLVAQNLCRYQVKEYKVMVRVDGLQ